MSNEQKEGSLSFAANRRGFFSNEAQQVKILGLDSAAMKHKKMMPTASTGGMCVLLSMILDFMLVLV